MKKLLILLLLATQSLSFGQQILKKKQSLLGSPFEITVVAKDSVQGNLFSDLAIAEVKRIENLISDWIPTSQISKVNSHFSNFAIQLHFFHQLVEDVILNSKKNFLV